MSVVKDWYSLYPIGLDNTTDISMPDLVNSETFMRVSHLQAVRSSLWNLEVAVGSDAYETGTIRYNLDYITFNDIYNNQSGIRTINVNDQPISFYGDQEIRFDGGPIRLSEQSSDPINIDNYGFIYIKHIDGYSELSYLDNYGNILQISNKGYSIDQYAIHKNIDSEISSIISAIPTSSDYLLIEDADDSNNKKSVNIFDIIPLTTKGDIFTYNSTTWDRLPIGTNDYILSVDSSESTGLKWVVNTAGSDPNAVHKSIPGEISILTNVTPTKADYLLIEDANDSNNKKHILVGDILPVGTKGDIFTYSTVWDKLPIGPDDYILSADSSESTGLKWISNSTITDSNAIHDNVFNEIATITPATMALDDYLLIEDADDSNNKKSINISDIVPLTTKGDIFTHNGTTWDKLSLGLQGQVLSVDTGEQTGLRWINNTTISGVQDGYVTLRASNNIPDVIDEYGALYVKKAINIRYKDDITTFNVGDSFDLPYDLTSDGTYLYITDFNNDRIVKFLASDLSYVDQFGSTGTGNNNFSGPVKITNDGTHLYIADFNNDRIKKHLISTWAYVDEIVAFDGQSFNQPFGLTIDGTYLYVVDNNNNRIVKFLASDLSYVDRFGSYGVGDNNFNLPRGITNDGIYLYITDFNNDRIKKHLMSNLSYVDELKLQYDLRPKSIANDGTYLYVSCENPSYPGSHNVIIQIDMSNFSIINSHLFDVRIELEIYNNYLFVMDITNERIIRNYLYYNQLEYLDNYGYSSTIVSMGKVHSYTGHGEDVPPSNPSSMDEEWITNELDYNKWSWDYFGAGEPNIGTEHWTVNNNHLTVITNGDSSSFSPITYSHCLIQNQTLSHFSTWNIRAKMKLTTTDYDISPLCGIIVIPEDRITYPNDYFFLAQSQRYVYIYRSGTLIYQRVIQHQMPILCIKYSTENKLDSYIGYDSDDQNNNALIFLDQSSFTGGLRRAGLFFYTRHISYNVLFCCNWFRAEYTPTIPIT